MGLLPRQEKFYEHFLDQTKLIREAASLLVEGTLNGQSRLEEVAGKIAALEHKADEIIHEIFVKLNRTFITPLDPEDIHALASHLDDVIDGIEDAAHRMAAYRLEPMPAPVKELCGIVNECALTLEKAMRALAENQALLEHCIELNRLEDNADQLVRRAVAGLFQQEKDPVKLLKLKEVYEFLELTTDRAEDVADALQIVAVKNS